MASVTGAAETVPSAVQRDVLCVTVSKSVRWMLIFVLCVTVSKSVRWMLIFMVQGNLVSKKRGRRRTERCLFKTVENKWGII